MGAVFTRPDHGNKGLATRVLDAAVDAGPRSRAPTGLVSGQRSLYERAGFAPYPACPRYRVNGRAGRRRPAVKTPQRLGGPTAPRRCPTLMELSRANRCTSCATRRDWQRLLGAGVSVLRAGRDLAAVTRGQGVAYLAVGRPGQAGDRRPGDPRGARVLELGGDRAEIAAAAPAGGTAPGRRGAGLILPPGDQSLASHGQPPGLAGGRGAHALHRRPGGTRPFAALPLPFYGFNYVYP